LIKVKIVQGYTKGKIFGLVKLCWVEGDVDIILFVGSVASPARPYNRTSMKRNALELLEVVALSKGLGILIA
jgi:hypothetical protein